MQPLGQMLVSSAYWHMPLLQAPGAVGVDRVVGLTHFGSGGVLHSVPGPQVSATHCPAVHPLGHGVSLSVKAQAPVDGLHAPVKVLSVVLLFTQVGAMVQTTPVHVAEPPPAPPAVPPPAPPPTAPPPP